MDGQAELTWVATHRDKRWAPRIEPIHVTHPSTERARRRLTSLIETNALPLRRMWCAILGLFLVVRGGVWELRRTRDNDVLLRLVVDDRDDHLSRCATRRALLQRLRHRRSPSNIEVFSIVQCVFSPLRPGEYAVVLAVTEPKVTGGIGARIVRLIQRYHRHAAVCQFF